MKIQIQPYVPGITPFGVYWDFWLGYIAIHIFSRSVLILWDGQRSQ